MRERNEGRREKRSSKIRGTSSERDHICQPCSFIACEMNFSRLKDGKEHALIHVRKL